MRNDGGEPRTSAYALDQLERALATARLHADPATRERAAAKVARWRSVIEGIADFTIDVGSRTPVASVPAWATLEVVHGGFATGALLAGGPLLAHETVPRATQNTLYLGDDGRRDLLEMLDGGQYRVNVPEEGALLAVAWLIARGDAATPKALASNGADRAAAVIDAIAPFFGVLRFYPVPDPRPIVSSAVVRVRPVADTASRLRARKTPPAIERMTEAITVWAPLYDRAVALFVETMEDGVPCKRFAPDWRARAQTLLDEYAALRARYPLGKKPDDPKENFAILRSYLPRCIGGEPIAAGDVARIRHAVESYVARRGEPGSARNVAERAAEAQAVAAPKHADVARALAARLDPYPRDGGIPIDALADIAAPLGDRDATASAPAGSMIPPALIARIEASLEASVDELVRRRVLTSSEAIAGVLPQMTSQLRAAGIDDPALRRLYAAVYAAFRRRRSLLLLDLEHQVKLDELPWVAAIDAFRRPSADTAAASRQALEQLVSLACTSFPYTVLPNKLLQEVRALATDARIDAPIVDELAADIFVGTFSEKFVAAAKIAARSLDGTLYARYYDLPCAELAAIDLAKREPKNVYRKTPAMDAFAGLCVARATAAAAAPEAGSLVAKNGTVIEQQQILTTQNLAALFDALDLRAALGSARLRELAEQCFAWVCRRLTMKVAARRSRLQLVKNAAYAWRQMIFFASLASDADRAAFVTWARAHFDTRGAGIRRFEPALRGLEAVAAGEVLPDIAATSDAPRRFLGWSRGAHWLLDG